MLRFSTFLVTTFLLLSGCALLPIDPQSTDQPVPVLSEYQKRQVYQQVVADLKNLQAKGDVSYRKGNYFQALTHYRQAFFYDPTLPELAEKIRSLERQVEESSATYYAKGKHYLTLDLEKALQAFNHALQVNPEHSQALKARQELLAHPEIAAVVAQLEKEISRAAAGYDGGEPEILLLLPLVETLLGYQHDNQLALSVKRRLAADREELLDARLHEGRQLYEAGNLEAAQEAFRRVQALDGAQDEAREYLARIKHRKEITQLLQAAHSHLEKDEHAAAVASAAQVLQLEPENPAAAEILHQARETELEKAYARAQRELARKEYRQGFAFLQKVLKSQEKGEKAENLREAARATIEEEMPGILEEGRALYQQNRLQEALVLLELVLEIDANSEADTYVKKIQSRLKTIESLQ